MLRRIFIVAEQLSAHSHFILPDFQPPVQDCQLNIKTQAKRLYSKKQGLESLYVCTTDCAGGFIHRCRSAFPDSIGHGTYARLVQHFATQDMRQQYEQLLQQGCCLFAANTAVNMSPGQTSKLLNKNWGSIESLENITAISV